MERNDDTILLVDHHIPMTTISAPLSLSQQQIWFSTKLLTDVSAYSMFLTLKLKGTIDLEEMIYAIKHIFLRHDQLRICINIVSDNIEQRILPTHAFPLRIVDYRTSPVSVIDLEAILLEESKQGFSLEHGQIFRVCIVLTHPHEAILMFGIHHICADAWSMGVMLRDFIQIYKNRLNQQETVLPPLQGSYFDFVDWQMTYRRSPRAATHLTWWKTELQGAPYKIALPLRTDINAQSDDMRGERLHFNLNAATLASLKKITASKQCTLYCMLFSLLSVLLYRYTGQEDFLIGVPVANRPKQAFYDLVGYFVNMVAVRVPLLSLDITFHEYLSLVKQKMLNAFSHSNTPFNDIMHVVNPDRNVEQDSPLMNVVLVLQNAPVPVLTDQLFSIELLSQHNGSAKFDLLFNFYEEKGQLQGILEYKASKLDRDILKGMVAAFQVLAQQVIADITQPIKMLRLLDVVDETKIIHQTIQKRQCFNLTDTPVHQFYKIVCQYSHQVALTHHDDTLTYHELNIAADQLASYLLSQGVDVGDLVAISMPVSFDLIISMLAILKLGAAYLPIDDSCPQDRFEYYLIHSNVKKIIIDKLGKYVLPEDILDLIVELSSIEQTLSVLPYRGILNTTLDGLSYVIYTSGSTGKPKGVKVNNRNVMSLFVSSKALFNFNEYDVWTFFHSYAFDFSVWEMWGALLFGGNLVLIDAEVRSCTDIFYQILQKHAVTILNQTPPAFYELINIDQLHQNVYLSSLRYVIFGGAPLSLFQLRSWMNKYGDSAPYLINMYGITEITIHATFKKISWHDVVSAPQNLIGIALPHLSLFVLDSNLCCVPPGAIGEAYIVGDAVSQGYLNSPELTKERFIEIPCLMPGLFYKTGDLVRFLNSTGLTINPEILKNNRDSRTYKKCQDRGALRASSGVYTPVNEQRSKQCNDEIGVFRKFSSNELEYIARADRQVKIRGYRIELNEIEQVILEHTSVKQAIVHTQVVNDNILLIAYIVPVIDVSSEKSMMDIQINLLTESQVLDWQKAFEHNYTRHEGIINDPLFNISGWHSAINKMPFSQEIMTEWLDAMLIILRSFSFSSVLEIGCGSGMILSRLLDKCDRYVATDFSIEALCYVEKEVLPRCVGAEKVKLLHAPANNFSALSDYVPDLVIMNSVVQYFPSGSYFLSIISQMITQMHSGGYIIIGDVRSLDLCGILYLDAMAEHASTMTHEQMSDFIELNVAEDHELLFSHVFFLSLRSMFPQISHVEIRAHQGTLCDELNLYRYDVILAIHRSPLLKQSDFEICNGFDLSMQKIEALISSLGGSNICITNILNRRLLQKVKSCPTACIARLLLPEFEGITGVDPVELSLFCRKQGITYGLLLNHRSALLFDLVICKTHPAINLYPSFYHENIGHHLLLQEFNHPIQKKWQDKIRTEIEAILNRKLPQYMLPTAYVFIDTLPMTQQGKINYKALPMPTSFFAKKTNLVNFLPPETDLERKITSAFEHVLKIREIGRFDNFFDLGGHSLLVVRLLFYLQEQLSIHVTIREIMAHATVSELAAYLEMREAGMVVVKNIDFSIDAQLPCIGNATAIESIPSCSASPSSIFLTGATGYLGIFILDALLENTQADIYCLIRAGSQFEATQKLMHAFKKYELYSIQREQTLKRVHMVCGDLRFPQFALNPEQFSMLCRHIDLIIHNGAVVNFMVPYASLKSANIEGTKTLLQWAIKQRLPLHYVSSLYVFTEQDVKHDMIYESQVPHFPHQLSLGYLQTKYVCEQLLVQARQLGLPVVNYRIGRISGSMRTGISPTYDFFWNFIRACLAIRLIPDIDFNINLIPVDYVSTFIAKIACCNRSELFKNYHILNSTSYSFSAYRQLLMVKYAHLRLTCCTFEAWKTAFKHAEREHLLDEKIISLFPLFMHMTSDSKIIFDNANSIEISKMLGIHMEEMHDAMMELYTSKIVSAVPEKK